MIPAAFGYRTRNLGDDMQTIAAALQLGAVHRLIDRDALADEIFAESHAAIFNSWFLKGEDYRLPPRELTPIFHGLAVGKEAWLTPDWLALLRQHEPIGCRDAESAALLEARGVRAYWSGCLTLFIGSFFTPIADAHREDVLFIDIAPDLEKAAVPAHLRACARRLSMIPPPAIRNNRRERLIYTAAIVERLRCARLVVTRRLHAALPAIGFGTPTIALPDASISNAPRRFSGFMDFINGAFQDDAVALSRIDWSPAPTQIPKALQDALTILQDRVAALGLQPHAHAIDAPAAIAALFPATLE